MSKSKPHVRLITFFVCASACLLRTVRMQLNFPIAVITAIAFAFGLVADVASSFSLSRSLINPSTLLDKSSDGVGIFIANEDFIANAAKQQQKDQEQFEAAVHHTVTEIVKKLLPKLEARYLQRPQREIFPHHTARITVPVTS